MKQTSEQQSVEKQAERYDAEAAAHAVQHQDEWTQKYRDISFRKPFANLDFNGKLVLDAMCASGVETGYLLRQGAEVEGLDISEQNCKHFTQEWDKTCHLSSIHETGLPDNHYDFVYICGGLHHIIPFMDETLTEVHRILKPGGHFLFVEPNADTWVNKFREIWYKRSNRFEDEERALSYKNDLQKFLSKGFEEREIYYGGNIAYLVLGQALSLGISQGMKAALASTVIWIERIVSFLPFAPKLFFTCVWQKTK